MRSLSFSQLFATLVIAFSILFLISLASAWTGPTATAPAGNVAAPVNVGTADQVKDAGISVNSLAVFGSQYIQDDLGIGVVSPVVSLETPGSIKIGDGAEVCQAVTEGAIRYNTTLNTLNYCDGSAWITLAAAETPSGQSFTTPGTYSFTVPNYSSMTVTMKAAGGGGGESYNNGDYNQSDYNTYGSAGGSGGNSSFAAATAYGGGGGGGGVLTNGGFHPDGSAGAAGGGTGGTVTTGGGAAGGTGQLSPRYGVYSSDWGNGGTGGTGGKVIKTYTTGDLSPGTIITVAVGAGGTTYGGAAGAGSVEIALTY